jgi:hypothetical protein
VQRVWHECWKPEIRSDDSCRGDERGWRFGVGGPILKASFGSPCYYSFRQQVVLSLVLLAITF